MLTANEHKNHDHAETTNAVARPDVLVPRLGDQ
jgi:hypothetical protein